MRPVIVACFFALASTSLFAADLIPLNDLGPRPYRLGYIGGLYENGSNVIPADHLRAGIELANEVQPLDANGQPSPSGKIVMLAFGTGDTDRVICAFPNNDCEAGSFMSMVRDSPRVNPALVVVNAATHDVNDPTTYFESVEDRVLLPAGVTAQQVQVGWMQMSFMHPKIDITCACSDTYTIKALISDSLHAMAAHFPNMRILYLSSRPFGGYSADAWNAEPFAYDSALVTRTAITEQIAQARTGANGGDGRIGNINYVKHQSPWIAWGPYLWANGMTPRSDGLTWQPEDYDGEFLSEKGAHKTATLLFDFLSSDPAARLWFLAPGASARARSVRH